MFVSKINGRGDSLGWRNPVDQTETVPKRRESKAEGVFGRACAFKICSENVTCHESRYTVREESRRSERDKLSDCKTEGYVTKVGGFIYCRVAKE
jgi:hypothetical protein